MFRGYRAVLFLHDRMLVVLRQYRNVTDTQTDTVTATVYTTLA